LLIFLITGRIVQDYSIPTWSS